MLVAYSSASLKIICVALHKSKHIHCVAQRTIFISPQNIVENDKNRMRKNLMQRSETMRNFICQLRIERRKNGKQHLTCAEMCIWILDNQILL